MANILDLLNEIGTAIYGRDVRQAIIDAITQCYEDGRAGVNDLQARTLIEAVMAVNEQQSAEIETLTARIEELESGGSGGSSETSTTSVPTFLVESGTTTFENVGANKTATQAITFTENFTEAPTVLAIKVFRQGANTFYSQVTAQPIQSSITADGFTLAVGNKYTQAVSPSVLWVAFQPTTVEVETEITTVDGMTEADVRALLAPIVAALDSLKIGYDGTVYDTAGASLREQINALHILIGDEPGTAIPASAIGYEDGNVEEALNEVNGRLDEYEDIFTGDVGESVSNWLDEHPEATTTVEDGSLTSQKLVIGTLGFVTPEMYGAKGDGQTDDTTAIQSAVNSGFPVRFGEKIYKTGTINVTRDICVDFGGCSFVGTSSKIFNCSGTQGESTTLSANYTAGSNAINVSDASNIKPGDLLLIHDPNTLFYSELGIDYQSSGLVRVEETTENVIKITNSIEFSMLSGAVVDVYTPIRVVLKNCAGIDFIDIPNSQGGFYLTGCIDSVIQNISEKTNDIKSAIVLQRCFNTLVSDCSISTNYNPESYYYIINISGGSAFTKVNNCDITAVWHAISTNGTFAVNHTTISGCVLRCLSETLYAYLDHGCGINTRIEKSSFNGAHFSNGFTVSGCEVFARADGEAQIAIRRAYDNGIDKCLVENTFFNGAIGRIKFTKRETNGKLGSVRIVNCHALGNTAIRLDDSGVDIIMLFVSGTYPTLQYITDCSIEKCTVCHAVLSECLTANTGIIDTLVLSDLIMYRVATALLVPVRVLQMENVVIKSTTARTTFRIYSTFANLNNVILDAYNSVYGMLQISTGVVLATNCVFALGTYDTNTRFTARGCRISGGSTTFYDIYTDANGKLYGVSMSEGQLVSSVLN